MKFLYFGFKFLANYFNQILNTRIFIWYKHSWLFLFFFHFFWVGFCPTPFVIAIAKRPCNHHFCSLSQRKLLDIWNWDNCPLFATVNTYNLYSFYIHHRVTGVSIDLRPFLIFFSRFCKRHHFADLLVSLNSYYLLDAVRGRESSI